VTTIGMSVVLMSGAVVLVLLGRWGRRNTAQLIPLALAPDDRVRQERVLRRGTLTCYFVAGLFLFAAIGTLF
jgi:hypothetical protein